MRGEQSAEVLDLRMACLREGLDDLGALVRMFRRPNPQVVENAVSAASALGNLERCENIELLRAVVRPPQDPSTRQEVEALRSRLAEVRALCRVGRIHEGLAAATLERAARELQYGPLLAEVLVAVCRLPEEQGDMESAARISEEALLTRWCAGTNRVGNPLWVVGAVTLLVAVSGSFGCHQTLGAGGKCGGPDAHADSTHGDRDYQPRRLTVWPTVFRALGASVFPPLFPRPRRNGLDVQITPPIVFSTTWHYPLRPETALFVFPS